MQNRKKNFPICTDETGTYAVVYNTGDMLISKAAKIGEDGSTIEIDVRKQKTVSAAQMHYEICTFEEVIVIGKEG